jgi:hypothetical protein
MLEERLPYATRPLYFPDGTCVEEFIIPDEDRELVLARLYPFDPIPKLTDQMIDIHTDKVFTVKDFRVTWEYGMNYLVSPYYPEGGGTVIDWMEEDLAADESEEEDWEGEDWDDDDFDMDDLMNLDDEDLF